VGGMAKERIGVGGGWDGAGWSGKEGEGRES